MEKNQHQQEEAILLAFINRGQIFGQKQSRASFQVQGSQIFKKVILETPSGTGQEKQIKNNFLLDQQLLLNEFLISREILKFQCVNAISKNEEKMDQEMAEYPSIEEYFGCHPNCGCIKGRMHLLLPSRIHQMQDRSIMVSPYADKGDAWSHLIQENSDSQIFNRIKDNFDEVKLDDIQIQLLIQARFILFSAMKVASQIGASIQHLHENLNISHNDLKPDNFFAHQKSHPLLPGSKEMFGTNLLNSDGTIIPKNPSEDDDEVSYYLSDFGFAKKIGFATSEIGKKFFNQKPWVYLAPEILAWGQNVDTSSIEKTGDVFAFGISLYQILFLAAPFSQNSMNELHHPNMFWARVSKQLRVYSMMTDIKSMMNLLEGMLERDPLKRLTIRQVLEHPWLSDIEKYLQIELTL